MACTPAPACRAALAQATDRWPKRSRDSDGICASPKHTAQNPTSDHETGDAWDLDHDPEHGVDTWELANELRLRCLHGDELRPAYIISRGRICTAWAKDGFKPWDWRPYTGANPHDHHMHVSLNKKRPGVRNDMSPWWAYLDESKELDMDEATLSRILDGRIAKACEQGGPIHALVWIAVKGTGDRVEANLGGALHAEADKLKAAIEAADG